MLPSELIGAIRDPTVKEREACLESNESTEHDNKEAAHGSDYSSGVNLSRRGAGGNGSFICSWSGLDGVGSLGGSSLHDRGGSLGRGGLNWCLDRGRGLVIVIVIVITVTTSGDGVAERFRSGKDLARCDSDAAGRNYALGGCAADGPLVLRRAPASKVVTTVGDLGRGIGDALNSARGEKVLGILGGDETSRG